jgi:hypothetical protein
VIHILTSRRTTNYSSMFPEGEEEEEEHKHDIFTKSEYNKQKRKKTKKMKKTRNVGHVLASGVDAVINLEQILVQPGGADMAVDDKGNTCLMLVCQAPQNSLSHTAIQALLCCMSDVGISTRNADGMTALMFVLAHANNNNNNTLREDVLLLLVERTAITPDNNLIGCSSSGMDKTVQPRKLLWLALRQPERPSKFMIKLLQVVVAAAPCLDLDLPITPYGDTALMVACRYGQFYDVMQFLLDHTSDAGINQRNIDNKTALVLAHECANRGNWTFIDTLSKRTTTIGQDFSLN